MTLDNALTPEQAHQVSTDLNQEAIAQHANGQGELHGPGADKWRPFNAEYFLNHDAPHPNDYTSTDVRVAGRQQANEVRKLEGPEQFKAEVDLPNAVGKGVTIPVVHMAGSGTLEEVNPAHFGKGMANRNDQRGHNKGYFFVAGSDMSGDSRFFGGGAHVAYGAKINGSQIYDLSIGKPDTLKWGSTLNRLAADEAVQAAGYKGIMVGTGDGRKVVMMFEPTKVETLGRQPKGSRVASVESAARAVTPTETKGDGGVRRFSYQNAQGETVGDARLLGKTVGDIAVKPEHQNKGYGTAIAQHLQSEGGQNAFAVTSAGEALARKSGLTNLGAPARQEAVIADHPNEKPENNYSWLDRSGKFTPVTGSHAQAAREILGRAYTDNMREGLDTMFAKGYARIVNMGDSLIAHVPGGGELTPSQRKALIAQAESTGKQKLVLDNDNDYRTIWASADIFASPREQPPKDNGLHDEMRSLFGLPKAEPVSPASVPGATPGGIAQRIALERDAEVEPGAGDVPMDVLKDGRTRLAQGASAEARIAGLTKSKAAASDRDFALFRARLEQLQKESNAKGEITPEETAFWNSVKPFTAQWSMQGRVMQGATDLDTGNVTFLGMQREFAKVTGRAMRPDEKVTSQQVVKDIQEAQQKQVAAEDTIKKSVVDMAKEAKVKIPTTKDELAQIIAKYYPKEAPGAVSAPSGGPNFPQEVRAAIWKYATDNYLTGMGPGKPYLPLEAVERAVAADLGMRPLDVRDVFAGNKVLRAASDEAYARQLQRRQMVVGARVAMENANLSATAKTFKAVWDGIRSFVVLGHANAPLTHGGFHIFWPEYWKTEIPAIKKSFQIMFGKIADATPASSYETMRREVTEDSDYVSFLRAGLQIKWGTQDDVGRYLLSGFKNSFLNKWATRGNMAMDTLKWLRLNLMKAEVAKLSPEERADPDTMKVVAGLVNNQTGILTAGTKGARLSSALSNYAFAPQLEGSRWLNSVLNPAKAAGMWFKGDSATMAEKVFRRQVTTKTAKIAAGYMAALGVNAAALALSKSDDQINFLDPTSSDWLAFKGDGHVFTAPSNALAPLRMLVAGVLAPHVKNANSDFGDRVKSYFFGKAHPAVNDIRELLEGKDAFSGRPLPWVSEKPRRLGEGPSKKPGLAWWEYASSKLPILAAQPLGEISQALQDQGVQPDHADTLVAGLVGTVGALFAVHSHEFTQPKKAHEVPWADIFNTQ
jgi:hypothetical protein